MLKNKLILYRIATPALLAATLVLSPAAQADEQSAMAELKAVQALADAADAEASRRLAAVRAALPPDASARLRRELQETEIRVRECVNGSARLGAGVGFANRIPGGDRADQGPREKSVRESPAPDPELYIRRLRQLATFLAAVLAATGVGLIFLLYRRAAEKDERVNLLNRQLEYQSTRDALTGVFSRRHFISKMNKRAESNQRDEDASDGTDCVALINLDHFKQINDRLGHEVGDDVLVEVARRLDGVVRDTDMIVRWSGEEFLVFSPNAHPLQMRMMLERLLGAVGATPLDAGMETLTVTITAGLTSVPFSGLPEAEFDWQKSITMAGHAMRHGKRRGRNQAQILVGLNGAPEEALAAAAAADFDAAALQGKLELIEIPGPGAPSP
jgi:diguanylate cyclase (GGDEF)-like protein